GHSRWGLPLIGNGAAGQAPAHGVGSNLGAGVCPAGDEGQPPERLPADMDLIVADHLNPSQDQAILLVPHGHGSAGDPQGEQAALYADDGHQLSVPFPVSLEGRRGGTAARWWWAPGHW